MMPFKPRDNVCNMHPKTCKVPNDINAGVSDNTMTEYLNKSLDNLHNMMSLFRAVLAQEIRQVVAQQNHYKLK